MVDGVEFWSNGEPSKPYKVIGLIEQNTISNLDYVLKNYNQSELIRLVRENEGDGLVSMKNDRIFKGYKSNFSVNPNYSGGFSGDSTTRTIYENKSILVVFKYK